ncbi:unnamed protein product [Adineta steineri]|uniref:PKD/REJ-like domain-containing protein n=1 Tax=Adineta steineri TaxID=433720 RepID=A0A815KPP0_9BILA|nr:unnamed protein product [Adineta steineri]
MIILIRIVFNSCYAPTITLIPSQSSLASPLQFRRSQDFSISSIIGFNCNGSLARKTQWTVKNCTSSSCLSQIQLNEKVITTLSEFYAPAKTFAYGIYELTLTVTMTKSPTLKSSSSAYVRITPTGITANPVELGTSMVTRGHQQNLLLDPGAYSVDPDEDSFNASKWKYEYYCRIYDESYNFPNLQGILLSIDDPRIDPLNPSCLTSRSDNGTQLIFGNLTLSPKSSLTILAGSLQSNQTYQFMVYMENRQNSSVQATGYVLVTVTDTQPQLVAVGIASCSSLLSTAQMLFEITLMSFDATDFTGADPFLGPFCFSLFIIIVVFICLSMFMSILNDGFHHVELNSIEDQQILSYMLKKFLNWTRKNYLIRLNKNSLFDILDLRRPNVEETYEIRDSRMHSQYVDPIENFPDKIDQLLEALDRIYIDQKKELLKLKRAGV